MSDQRPHESFHRAPEHEAARLIGQAEALSEMTKRFLTSMNVAAGLNVVIIGCGAGDDAFLAGELVGPEGSVVGIDTVEAKISIGQQRARDKGLSNVRFELSSAEAFQERGFDLAFGRYVLMHCSDPSAMVRTASGLVKRHGKIGFHEIDLLSACQSTPPAPRFDALIAQIVEAPRAYLPSPDAARRLLAIYLEAELPAPSLLCERLTAGGDPTLVSRWIAGFAGKAHAYFEPDAPPLDLTGLERELCADIQASGSQIATFDQWCAVSKKF